MNESSREEAGQQEAGYDGNAGGELEGDFLTAIGSG